MKQVYNAWIKIEQTRRKKGERGEGRGKRNEKRRKLMEKGEKTNENKYSYFPPKNRKI